MHCGKGKIFGGERNCFLSSLVLVFCFFQTFISVPGYTYNESKEYGILVGGSFFLFRKSSGPDNTILDTVFNLILLNHLICSVSLLCV